MSTAPPSRTASVAEPRRTSAATRQKNRPAEQDHRPDPKASLTRRGATTTTTETRTERRAVEERVIRRTRSPLKPAEARKGRDKDKDAATERPVRTEKVRTDGEAAAQCE
ncbi:hypothetical protein LTR08_003059 [Meristemomyces frigidus]|nr:hypothetical protein LTR08_003059 [Meristemomyces frigidus]